MVSIALDAFRRTFLRLIEIQKHDPLDAILDYILEVQSPYDRLNRSAHRLLNSIRMQLQL